MNTRNSALGYGTSNAAVRGVVHSACLLLAAACAGAGLAHAQNAPPPFRRRIGDYTVFYNAVRTAQLPESVLQQNGLGRPSEHEVLLDVAVRKNGKTVPARIKARAMNLDYVVKHLKLRASKANGMISYLGTVHIATREVLRFHLRVHPMGARQSYTVEFRERFLPRGQASGG